MSETPRERIASLAQQSKSLVQQLADMVNKGIDAGADLQPQRFNELATRAIFCADEITRLARQLHPTGAAERTMNLFPHPDGGPTP